MRTQQTHLAIPKKPTIHPPNINVTPLVDVLLVLLIIFFVIQPHREARFDSRIPQKPDYPSLTPPADLLLVDLKSGMGLDQVVELNTKSMSLMELGVTLKELLEQRIEKTVYIKAPRDKRYGEVVNVIDVMKGAGAEPIGLQIDYLS